MLEDGRFRHLGSEVTAGIQALAKETANAIEVMENEIGEETHG